ncbi:hypothetical protein BJX76DRAFT_314026 [Aspergillus varians]
MDGVSKLVSRVSTTNSVVTDAPVSTQHPVAGRYEQTVVNYVRVDELETRVATSALHIRGMLFKGGALLYQSASLTSNAHLIYCPPRYSCRGTYLRFLVLPHFLVNLLAILHDILSHSYSHALVSVSVSVSVLKTKPDRVNRLYTQAPKPWVAADIDLKREPCTPRFIKVELTRDSTSRK